VSVYEFLEPEDRVLVETLEAALKAGVGRSFVSPRGQRLRVAGIDETYVELTYGPQNAYRLKIPRGIREAAIKQARALAEAKRAGRFPV
jgi:hypothetical protein